jgi:tetratricopeptide (TPR) repeat protein
MAEWVPLMGADLSTLTVLRGTGPAAEMRSTVLFSAKTFLLFGSSAPPPGSLLPWSAEDSRVQELEAFDPPANEISLEKLICVEIHDRVRCVIGENDVIPGFELPLRLSSEGDHMLVFSHHKYAFGPAGRRRSTGIGAVPPSCNLLIEIRVHAHSYDDDRQGIDVAAIFDHVRLRKDVGNRWFSYGDIRQASRQYSKGCKAAEDYISVTMPKSAEHVSEECIRKQISGASAIKEELSQRLGESDEDFELRFQEQKRIAMAEHLKEVNKNAAEAVAKEKAQVEAQGPTVVDPTILQEYINCLNNLATCYLSAYHADGKPDYLKAKEICTRILEVDRNNIKGLLKAVRVSTYLGDYVEASLCVDLLKKIAPAHPQLAVEVTKLSKAKADYRRREKEMSLQMTKKLFPKNSVRSDSPADKSSINMSEDNVRAIKNSIASDSPVNSVSIDIPEDNISACTKSTNDLISDTPDDAVSHFSFQLPQDSSSGLDKNTAPNQNMNADSVQQSSVLPPKSKKNNSKTSLIFVSVCIVLISALMAFYLSTHQF